MKNGNIPPIYDARALGLPRMTLLGLQHVFAMFGATVIVPLITGLDVSTTLLFAGIGTLMFHFITRWSVPAFLGSSFAFLGGYASMKQLGVAHGMTETMALNYACLGVACAALLYFVMAALIRVYGVRRILRFFPPVVTGPIVIAIGLTLTGSAITNCQTNWMLAIVAIATTICASIWGRGIIRIVPILLGVLLSYITAACCGEIDFTPLSEAAWIGFPVSRERTPLAIFDNPDQTMIISSIVAITPIAFATMMEHIGDMCAISSTVGKDFLSKPGLHRTLSGDGIATLIASLFGAPADTTYGENTGVLNITRVFDPRVIRIAAVFAIILAFCPKFACLIALMPSATIGGISLILYGMISAVGIRNLIEEKVDFTVPRNVFIATMILSLSVGVKYGAADDIAVGPIHISGLALAAFVGIVLNAIIAEKPGNAPTEPNPIKD